MIGGLSRPFSISRFIIGLVLFVCALLSSSIALQVQAAANINRAINYQGRLLTTGGTNVADGVYAMKFSIYNVASAGTALWTASGTTAVPTTVNVQVTDGLFSVLLGDTSFQGQNPFAFDFNQDGLYLGVSIAGDSEMTPRKRLSAVPYAFNSEALQGQYASSSDISGTSGTGTLFALNQANSAAASATRTTLLIETAGTSDFFDYLLRAKPKNGADVFSISRAGNVTSTGNFVIGDASTDLFTVNAHINSDLIPSQDLAYSLGSASLRWNAQLGNVTSTNVTTTNLFASGTVSTTQLFVNGTQITGGAAATTATLQTITNNGATTTNLIYAQGGVFSSASSTFTSALTVLGQTSLQLLSFTNATGSAVTTTNLFVSGTASTSQLFVNGSTVCLTTGVNCQPAAASYWTYDGLNNVLYTSTSTQDVLLGGSSTATALFIVDAKGNTGTATNTVLLGAATTVQVGINVLNPSEALDVSGNVENILPEGHEYRMVSEVNTGSGESKQIIVVGRLMYSLFFSGPRLDIHDITDPAHPTLLSSTDVSYRRMRIVGTTIFGVDPDAARLVIQDASDPKLVRTVSTVSTSGLPMQDLEIAGNALYVVGYPYDDAVRTFDITDLAHPRFVTTTFFVNEPTPITATRLARSGNWLYASGNDGFAVLDIRQGFAPVVSTSTNAIKGNSIAVQGNYAYLGSTSGFSVVDLSNATSPEAVYTSTTDYTDPVVFGRYLLMRNVDAIMLDTLDVTSATHPVVIARHDYGSIVTMTVAGKYLFAGYDFGSSGYTSRIYDLTGIETTSLIAHSAEIGILQVRGDIRADGNLTVDNGLYVGSGGLLTIGPISSVASGTRSSIAGGLTVFNQVENLFARGQDLRVMSSSTVGYSPSSVYVSGKYSYITNRVSSTMDIYDVANPALPVLISSVGTVLPNSVVVSGRYAYVGNESNEISIFDVADPVSPILVTSFTLTAGSIQQIALQGRYLYVADAGTNSLIVIDVANPEQPVIVGSNTNVDGPSDIQIVDNYAYISNSVSNTVSIIDISNPTAPSLSSLVAVGANPSSVAVSGKYLFSTDSGDSTLTIHDISNHSAPTYVNTFFVPQGTADIQIHGRYAYVANGNSGLTVVDVFDPTNPTILLTKVVMPASEVFVSGRYAYLLGQNTDSFAIVDIAGVETNALAAYSAEIGNLQVLTDSAFGNQVSIGGGLSVGSGGIFSLGSLAIGSLDTTSTFAFAVSSTIGEFSNRLTVGGVNVCLENGINCPSSGGASYWTYDGLTDLLSPSTSSQAVMIGGATTGTALFTADTANDNLILAAKDTQKVGIGTTTPAEQLDVIGNVRNLLVENQAFSVVQTLNADVEGSPDDIAIFGDYAIATLHGSSRVRIYNKSNVSASAPFVSELTGLSGTRGVSVQGNYAYVIADSFLYVIDISNPGEPVLVSTVSSIASGRRIVASGRYAYVAGSTFVTIYDISNPAELQSIASYTLPGFSGARDIAVQGMYAYVAGSSPSQTSGTLYILNIANPAAPVLSSSYSIGSGFGPNPEMFVDVQGSYVYMTRSTGSVNDLYIFGASTSTSPVLYSTLSLQKRVRGVRVSGRYAYVADADVSNTSMLDIVDVADPSNPIFLKGVDLGNNGQPKSVTVSGRYAYVTRPQVHEISVVDIHGIETNGLYAGSAYIGNLLVNNDAQFSNSLSISGGLTIGNGGIQSVGAIAVASTNTTSTFAFAVSSTAGEYSQRLTVGGVNVCLEDGTNCPTGGSGPSYWTYDGLNDLLYPTTSTQDVMLGGSTTGTSLFTVDFQGNAGTATNTILLGANTTTLVGIGTSTPAATLDVVGHINNLIQSGSEFPLLSQIDFGSGGTNEMVVDGNTLYALYGGNLGIVDITNSRNPTVLNSLAVSGDELRIVGHRAYVMDGDSGILSVVDISNPATMSILDTVGSGGARGFDLVGNYAYVNTGTGIDVVDVSSSTNLVFIGGADVGSNQFTNGGALREHKGFIYVFGNAGNAIYDIRSNPREPVYVTSSNQYVGYDFAFQGDNAYVVDVTNGFYILSYADSVAPALLASLPADTANHIRVNGRYAYTNNQATTFSVYDIADPANPRVVKAIDNEYPLTMTVSGNKLILGYLRFFFNPYNIRIYEIPGIETSSLLADSVEVGTLNAFGNIRTEKDLTVGQSLFVGEGGILSHGPGNFMQSLTLNGVNVCLQDGMNCPASGGGTNFWAFDELNNVLYSATPTQDLILGDSASATAPFIFDYDPVMSSVQIGPSLNANLFVGTTTYGGGLQGGFNLSGGGIYSEQQIGSGNGLYALNEVTIGDVASGTSMTNAGVVSTYGGLDLTLNAFGDNSAIRFGTGSFTEKVIITSSGNMGIGLTLPTEALDVNGNIQNVLHPENTPVVGASLSLTPGSLPSRIVVQGRYGYVLASSTLNVIDLNSPLDPVQVGTAVFDDGADPQNIAIAGNYAFIANHGNATMAVVDISNPTSPLQVATTTFTAGSNPQSIVVNGKYAYVGHYESTYLATVDISNPLTPVQVATTTFSVTMGPYDMVVQGRYLYLGNGYQTNPPLLVVDLQNPAIPVEVGYLNDFGFDLAFGVAVQGRYAYIADSSQSVLRVVDVSNPASPVQIATTTINAGDQRGIFVAGRYAYLVTPSSDFMSIIDVSNPYSPVQVATTTLASGANPMDVFVSGRYAYVVNQGNDSIDVIDIHGTEVNGLIAHSAELGTLQVRNNATIENQLNIGGGLQVGTGGVLSFGALAVASTNTTSTFTFAVSAGAGEFSNRLTVGGVNVCLEDGTNCPTSGSGPSYWTYDGLNDVLYPTTSTQDVLLGGSTTATAGFIFDQSLTGTSTVIVGGSTNTNLLVGTSTYGGGLNSRFGLSGNDLLVQGMIGSIEGMFSATGVTVGTGTTVYGDGFLYKNNGAYTMTSVAGALTFQTQTSGNIVLDPVISGAGTSTFGGSTADASVFTSRVGSDFIPTGDSFYRLGNSTNRWLGLEATNVTSTSIVTNNLTVLNGITVSTTAPALVRTVRHSARIDTPSGNESNVVVSGKYAYVMSTGSGNGRLAVVDISYPSSATTVGVLSPFVSGMTRFTIGGKYAYGINGGIGNLVTMDISNPAQPSVISNVTVTGTSSATDITVSGKYAYLARSGGLTVLDISSSTAPTWAGSYTSTTGMTSAGGVALVNNVAYVASANQVSAIDVTSSTGPFLKSMVRDTTTLAGARYVAASGKRLYVAATNRLTIVDISTPTGTVVLGSLLDSTNLSGADQIAVTNNVVYVTSRSAHKVVAIDVADPTNPYIKGVYTDATNMETPTGIVISGLYAYVSNGSAAGTSGFTVLSLSGMEMGGLTAGSVNAGSLLVNENADIAGQLNVRGGITSDNGGILTTGELGVLGGGTSTIVGKLDALGGMNLSGDFLSIPSTFGSSSIYAASTTQYQAVIARDRYAYALETNTNFVVLDGTSGVPQYLGLAASSTALPTNGGFDLAGNYAYIAAGTRFTVIDISKPTAPSFVYSTNTGAFTTVTRVKVKGRYAYLAQTSGAGFANVLVYDISNPIIPKLVRSISNSGAIDSSPNSIDINGNYLYVAGATRFTVIDITNPTTATTTGSVLAGVAVNAIAARGQYVWSHNGGTSMRVFDVTNAANPTVSTCGNLTGSFGGISLAGRYAYVGGGFGLEVVDISSTSTCRQISVQQFSPLANVQSLSVSGKTLFAATAQGFFMAPVVGIEASSISAGNINANYFSVNGGFTVMGAASFSGGIHSASDIVGYGVFNSLANGTSTFQGAVSSTYGLFDLGLQVGGVNVCLQNGTNCSASAGSITSSTWQFSLVNNTAFLNTSTMDVLMGGGNTTSSALFVVDYRGNTGTATNTILLGGVTTTFVGIGTSTPQVALDVAGSVSNILRSGQTLSLARNITGVGTTPNQVFVRGNYMYLINAVAAADNFKIFDVSNPASSTVVGKLTVSSGTPQRMSVVGNTAYVITETPARLYAIDISEPGRPSEVSFVAVNDTSLRDIDVSGQYAYVSSFQTGKIEKFNVLDRTAMTSVMEISSSTHGWNDIEVQGRFLYAVDNFTPTLQIYDASATTPTLKSEISIAGAQGLSVQGRFAYVTLSTGGVQVVDISSSTRPVALGSVVIGTNSNRSVVDGRYLYLSNESGSAIVSVVDISSSTAPSLVSTITVGTNPRGLSVAGKYLYVPNSGSTSVSIIDLLGTEVSSLTAGNASIGGLQVLRNAIVAGKLDVGSELTVGGRFVCLSDGTGCPSIGGWTESTTNNTTYLSTVGRDVLLGGSTSATAGFIWDKSTNGTSTLFVGATTNTNVVFGVNTTSFNNITGLTGYVMDGNDLLVGGKIGAMSGLSVRGNIDGALGVGQSFRSTSTNFNLGYSGPVVVHDRYMYQANSGGLVVYDISQYGIPRIVKTATTYFSGGNYNDIAYMNGMVLLSSSDGYIVVVDVSSSTNPIAVTQWGNGGAINRQHALPHPNGRYVYTTNGSAQINVTDLINPVSPLELFTTSTNGGGTQQVTEMVTDGRYLYVAIATVTPTFEIYDLKNPTRPVKISQITSGLGGLEHLAVQGDYVYLVEGPAFNEIDVVDVRDRFNPRIVKTFSPDGGTRADAVLVSGRYLYLGSDAPNNVDIYDVSSSTNPIFIQNITETDMTAGNIALAGKYLYTSGLHKIGTIDVGTMETNALQAYTAEITRLMVRDSLDVFQDARIEGSLTVGSNSLDQSYGSISVYASTTSGTVMTLVNNSFNSQDAVLEVRGGCTANSIDLALFGNRNDNRKVSIRCDGQIYADNGTVSTPADYAEYFFASSSSLTAGDAVVLNADVLAYASTSKAHILMGETDLRAKTLGIVSTRPGFVANGAENRENDPDWKVIALMGQVPAKADATLDPIVAGDEIMLGAAGTIVKAHGPGMVVGRALEPLNAGTGTIQVYVQPHWWAGDLFSTDGSGNSLLVDDLMVTSSTIASVSSTLVDSPFFTFTAKAWDSVSSTEVTQSFKLFADAISSTTSLFSIVNASGTSLLDLSNEGDLTVHGKLYLANKSTGMGSTSTYLFIDDTAPSSTMVSTNADGFQAQAAYDYAERYPSQENLEPGDLVTFDLTGPVNGMKRTSSAQDAVSGIVSTKPGFLTGAYSTGTYPIALAGRVPTKVTASNGAIKVGDALTASNIPGVAMKATQPGIIVGYALENFDLPDTGLVQVFVKTGYFGGTVAVDGSVSYGQSASVEKIELEGLALIAAGQMEVKVHFDSLKALPAVYVTPGASVDGGWWVTAKSDTGFTIVLEKAQMHDVEFSWMVHPLQMGVQRFKSDNTNETVDPLSGNGIPVVQDSGGESPSSTTSTQTP